MTIIRILLKHSFLHNETGILFHTRYKTDCFDCSIFKYVMSKPNKYMQSVITIHRMDPDGCSHPCSPLHLVFTVAKPKSPTFTVKSSNRNISNQPLRIFQFFWNFFNQSHNKFIVKKCYVFFIKEVPAIIRAYFHRLHFEVL